MKFFVTLHTCSLTLQDIIIFPFFVTIYRLFAKQQRLFSVGLPCEFKFYLKNIKLTMIRDSEISLEIREKFHDRRIIVNSQFFTQDFSSYDA